MFNPLWVNCQKRPNTIRLRYPVPGTVLVGTGAGAGAGFEKMAGTEPDIWYIPISYYCSMITTYDTTHHLATVRITGIRKRVIRKRVSL